MPLDGKDGERTVDKPFDHIIPGAADRDKPLSGAVYRLMVGGVYLGARSVELVKEITPAEIAVKNIVKLVAPDPSVSLGCVDMLRDAAAEVDVDKLETFADAEHGLFLRCKTGEDFELEDIQLRVDMAGAAVGLPEEGGRDVAAAREKKVGGVVGLGGICADKAGDAQLFYKAFIVFCVLGTTCDEYGGSGHGGILSAGGLLYFMRSVSNSSARAAALSGAQGIYLEKVKDYLKF